MGITEFLGSANHHISCPAHVECHNEILLQTVGYLFIWIQFINSIIIKTYVLKSLNSYLYQEER
jgi:hypothetical protein